MGIWKHTISETNMLSIRICVPWQNIINGGDQTGLAQSPIPEGKT